MEVGHLMVAKINPESKISEKIVLGDLDSGMVPGIQVTLSTAQAKNRDLVLSLEVDLKTEKHKARVLKTWEQSLKLDSEFVLKEAFNELAVKIAPKMYELDPRIGMSILLGGGFPVSPLFDRVNFNPAIHAERYLSKNTYHNSECPFCQLLTDDTSIWGGGNLGWVHKVCAPWAPPKDWCKPNHQAKVCL